jgi:PAS domain S-box-containing protein
MPGKSALKAVSISCTAFLLAVMLYVAVSVHPTILQFRYNPYAILSLLGLIANTFLLIVMQRMPTKVTAIYLYSVFLLALVLWSGAEFLQRLSATREGALFWSNLASVAWMILPACLIIFVLSYMRRESWVNNSSFYFFLIISTIAFIYVNLTGNAFIPFTQDHLTVKPWGYNSGVEQFFPVFLIWFELLMCGSLALLGSFFLKAHRKAERQQALYFVGAVAIPVIFGSLTDGVLPIFGINIYPMAVTLTTLTAVIITYSIVKYGLFVFSPVTVASNILETMEEVVIAVSPSFVIEFANRRAEEMLGYNQNDLLGRRLDVIFPHVYSRIKKEVLTPLKHERFAHIDKTAVYTAKDKEIPVSISAARVTDIAGGVNGYLLILTDITALEASLGTLQEKVKEIRNQNNELVLLGEQLAEEKASVSKQVEERTRELQQSRAQLMASINSVELGFVMINPDSEIVLLNEAVTQMLKQVQKTSSHKKTHTTLADIEKAFSSNLDLNPKIKDCLENRKSLEIKEVLAGSHYFHFFISPIVLTDEAIGAVILIQDITENKVLDRSKDEFFSIASHELRTPLTAIIGYAELVQTLYADKLSDERFNHMMHGIDEGGERLIRIINEFLNMSRLEQGQLLFKKEPVDMIKLIKEVDLEVTPLLEDKGLRLNLHTARMDPPIVLADKDKVKEVLVNLVGNAIKFTEKGSITISLEMHPDTIQVRVHDTGRGISIENQSLLFRKFQQAGSSLTAREASAGTGLGLYISRLIIEGMGGSIFLESSAPHHGSTFSFTLPLNPPPK